MQLRLIPQHSKLTARQTLALQAIREAGWDGLHSYDLGCKIGCHPDWADTNGFAVGKALRKKGLVQQRRRPNGMVWTVAGKLERPDSPQPGELPDGF